MRATDQCGSGSHRTGSPARTPPGGSTANPVAAAESEAGALITRFNGIDWLQENAAGKVCIDLDIDRQNITVHGSPREIDQLVRREVETGQVVTAGGVPATVVALPFP